MGQKLTKYFRQALATCFYIVVVFGSVTIGLTEVKGATQDVLTFQARILSKDRASAPTASYNFRFKIFNTSSGGSEIWSEDQSSVAVRNGLFTVNLGSVNSLGTVNFASSDLYLSIEFDSNGDGSFEQSFDSRLPLTAVPTAKNAQSLGGKAESVFADRTENETITGAYTFQNTVDVHGVFTVNAASNLMGSTIFHSNVTLGNDSSDLINFDGRIASSLVPSSNNTYDLGASDNFFRHLYIENGTVSNQLNFSSTSSSSSAGLLFGGDTNLYRTGANVLKTDDTFRAKSGLLVGSQSTDVKNTEAAAYIYEANTSSSDRYGLRSVQINVGNGAAVGVFGTGYKANGSSGGNAIGVYGSTLSEASGANTISSAKALYAINTLGVATTTNAYGLHVDTTTGTGITNNYGIYISPQTAGSTDVGLYVAKSDTYSIQIADTGGTASGGITFATDTNLYRSAANTLKTDDTLAVATAVGIGIDAPSTILHIKGDSATSTFESTNNNDSRLRGYADRTSADLGVFSLRGDWGTVASSTTIAQIDFITGADTINKDDGQLWFRTTSGGSIGTRLQIGSAGDIIFNTANATYPVYFGSSLDTNLYRGAANELATDDLLSFGSSGSSKAASATTLKSYVTDATGGAFILDTSATLTTASLFVLKENGTQRLAVDPSGNLIPGSDGALDLGQANARWKDVYATNGSIQTSDRNLKKEIKTLDYGLNEILALNSVSYKWIDSTDNTKHLGLIAQDVQKVIPEAVVGSEPGRLGLRYTELIPVVIKAIQEQNNEINAIKDILGADSRVISTINSQNGKDLELVPSSGKAIVKGSLWVNNKLVANSAELGDTRIDGALTVKGSVTGASFITNGSTETDISIPSQGDKEYSVIVTWSSDPGQPYWVQVLDAEHFRIKTQNPVNQDAHFRYLIIDNQ